MSTRKKRDEAAERQHDATVEDSFPASDPPANSGIVGPRIDAKQEAAHRRPPHKRGADERPAGTPTDERHAAETAHAWEDDKPTSRG